jgi:hypothetical protein
MALSRIEGRHWQAGEQAEEIRERPEQCPDLAGVRSDRARHAALQDGFAIGQESSSAEHGIFPSDRVDTRV